METLVVRGPTDVQKLNEMLPRESNVLVGYFMANCRHCDDFKPEWSRLMKKARRIPSQGAIVTLPEALMGGVGCDKPRMFPGVRHYKHGKLHHDYTGNRTAKDIEQYIRRHFSGPSGTFHKRSDERKRHRGGRRRRRRTWKKRSKKWVGSPEAEQKAWKRVTKKCRHGARSAGAPVYWRCITDAEHVASGGYADDDERKPGGMRPNRHRQLCNAVVSALKGIDEDAKRSRRRSKKRRRREKSRRRKRH